MDSLVLLSFVGMTLFGWAYRALPGWMAAGGTAASEAQHLASVIRPQMSAGR